MAVNLISEKIPSNRFTDIKLAHKIEQPPKISTGVSLKNSAPLVPGLSIINSKIPMEWRKSPNPSTGPLII